MFEQRRAIERSRASIAEGRRPMFHVVTTWDGSAVDVRIVELPVIHLFVPDSASVVDGARTLIARTLQVHPDSFTVELSRER